MCRRACTSNRVYIDTRARYSVQGPMMSRKANAWHPFNVEFHILNEMFPLARNLLFLVWLVRWAHASKWRWAQTISRQVTGRINNVNRHNHAWNKNVIHLFYFSVSKRRSLTVRNDKLHIDFFLRLYSIDRTKFSFVHAYIHRQMKWSKVSGSAS